jgi:ATP-dependent DNA helicase RecG
MVLWLCSVVVRSGRLKQCEELPARKYPASTPQVLAVLKAAAKGECSREDLQAAAGMKDRENFRRQYIEPLLSAELLERTIPDKPRSSRQKYCLTADGRAFLRKRNP